MPLGLFYVQKFSMQTLLKIHLLNYNVTYPLSNKSDLIMG